MKRLIVLFGILGYLTMEAGYGQHTFIKLDGGWTFIDYPGDFKKLWSGKENWGIGIGYAVSDHIYLYGTISRARFSMDNVDLATIIDYYLSDFGIVNIDVDDMMRNIDAINMEGNTSSLLISANVRAYWTKPFKVRGYFVGGVGYLRYAGNANAKIQFNFDDMDSIPIQIPPISINESMESSGFHVSIGTGIEISIHHKINFMLETSYVVGMIEDSSFGYFPIKLGFDFLIN